MNDQKHEYRPVPVQAAYSIGRMFKKDVVVILCWDSVHNLIHTTTWGNSANDKLVAAETGETVTRSIGCDPAQKRVFEDFRLDAAKLKEENDALRARLAELEAKP